MLFPVAPLHDNLSKKLKIEFERALLRVFRILDKDCDKYLSDDELRDFQHIVFKSDLSREHISAFKEVLVAECDDFDDEESIKGVNFESFKTFNRILIRKLRMEICWTILRFFGYDNDLLIKEELWNDKSIPDE